MFNTKETKYLSCPFMSAAARVLARKTTISQQRELRWTEFLTIEAPSIPRTWLVHQLGHAPVSPLALGHCTGNLSVGSESNLCAEKKMAVRCLSERAIEIAGLGLRTAEARFGCFE